MNKSLLVFFIISLSTLVQANPLWNTFYTFNDFTPNAMTCNSTNCYIIGFNDNGNTIGFRKLNVMTKQVTRLLAPPVYMNTTRESLTLLGQYIYTITGDTNKKPSVKLFRYSLSENKWSELAHPLHLADQVSGPSKLVPHNNQLFNFERNLAYTYNVESNKWSKLKESYHKRSDADSFLYKNKIYVYGGFEYENQVKDVEIYDLKANKWSYIIPSINLNTSSVLFREDQSALVITLKNKKHELYSWDFIKNTYKKININSNLLQSVSPISLPRSVKVENRFYILNKKKILQIKYK